MKVIYFFFKCKIIFVAETGSFIIRLNWMVVTNFFISVQALEVIFLHRVVYLDPGCSFGVTLDMQGLPYHYVIVSS